MLKEVKTEESDEQVPRGTKTPATSNETIEENPLPVDYQAQINKLTEEVRNLHALVHQMEAKHNEEAALSNSKVTILQAQMDKAMMLVRSLGGFVAPSLTQTSPGEPPSKMPRIADYTPHRSSNIMEERFNRNKKDVQEFDSLLNSVVTKQTCHNSRIKTPTNIPLNPIQNRRIHEATFLLPPSSALMNLPQQPASGLPINFNQNRYQNTFPIYGIPVNLNSSNQPISIVPVASSSHVMPPVNQQLQNVVGSSEAPRHPSSELPVLPTMPETLIQNPEQCQNRKQSVVVPPAKIHARTCLLCDTRDHSAVKCPMYTYGTVKAKVARKRNICLTCLRTVDLKHECFKFNKKLNKKQHNKCYLCKTANHIKMFCKLPMKKARECEFCKNNTHIIEECASVKVPAKERRQKIIEENRCLKCLEFNDDPILKIHENCQYSTHICQLCHPEHNSIENASHHPLLCEYLHDDDQVVEKNDTALPVSN